MNDAAEVAVTGRGAGWKAGEGVKVSDKLLAQVKATNRANAEAVRLYPLLVKAVAPFVGQQVKKATGELTEKFKKALPEFDGGGGNKVQVYRQQSDYSLAWVVKTWEHESPFTVTYAEAVVYVGEIHCKTLTKLTEKAPQLRTDYDAFEVARLRKVYEEKRKEADEARSALYPFGEYDR
jgi:hypothetical protein